MRLILLSIFTFFSFLGKGQVNLVPNFGFEAHDTCPSNEDQVQYATGWYKCSGDNVIFIGNTTPDYYNSCAPSSGFGVPQSGLQYQPDLRSCGAYMGLCTQNMPSFSNYREQIGIQLSSPLVIGQKYYLSFITVMGANKVGTDYYGNPSNNIGMRLSTIAYNNSSSPAPLDNFAHLSCTAIITGSVNWTRITGSIIADSAYNYVLLGNFFDDANTDTLMYSCGTCYNYYGYYLIDNICISTDSSLCNGGVDSAPCTVSVKELSDERKIKAFPNPVTDVINITFDDIQCNEVQLLDILGNVIYTETCNSRKGLRLNLSEYPSGLYFLN